MPETNMWQYLSGHGLAEALLAIFVIVLGTVANFRGSVDKKSGLLPMNGGAMPPWTMYGPVHDTMEVIRVMAENGREYNRIMSRIEEKMNATGKAQWEAVQRLTAMEDILREKLHQEKLQTMWLEELRNNQVLRPEGTIGIPRRK